MLYVAQSHRLVQMLDIIEGQQRWGNRLIKGHHERAVSLSSLLLLESSLKIPENQRVSLCSACVVVEAQNLFIALDCFSIYF